MRVEGLRTLAVRSVQGAPSCAEPLPASCVNVIQTLHLFSYLENGGAGLACCSG